MTPLSAVLARVKAATPDARFVHFSKEPLARVNSVAQNHACGKERGDKPNGLWFSVEGGNDGWRSWCEGESFSLDALAFENEITFANNANLLCLNSATDIDAFTLEYRKPPEEWEARWGCRARALYWDIVAERYDGIIIAPYIYERRLSDHCSWYYSWDCASGVVWNAEAVAALESRALRDRQDKEKDCG